MNNKEIVKYFYERVVSNHSIEDVDKFISEDCSVRMGDQLVLVGIEGMKQHLIDIRKTYPDYTMTIVRQFEDGDHVISEFIMQGTHQGEWLGMKPTNKRLSFTGVDIDRVINGRIVEHGGAVNTFETLFAENIIGPI